MLGFPSDCSFKDRRGHSVAERTVGPFMIIQPPPVFDHHSRLWQALEKLCIKAFAAKRAVEAFVTPVLPGFPRFDSTRNNSLVFHKHLSDCERPILGRCHCADTVGDHAEQ